MFDIKYPFARMRLALEDGRPEARMLRLVKRNTTPEQFAEFERCGQIVTTGQSGLTYRIEPHWAHIYDGAPASRNGRPLFSLCHAWHYCVSPSPPDAELVLAVKLMIERDEQHYIALAGGGAGVVDRYIRQRFVDRGIVEFPHHF